LDFFYFLCVVSLLFDFIFKLYNLLFIFCFFFIWLNVFLYFCSDIFSFLASLITDLIYMFIIFFHFTFYFIIFVSCLIYFALYLLVYSPYSLQLFIKLIALIFLDQINLQLIFNLLSLPDIGLIFQTDNQSKSIHFLLFLYNIFIYKHIGLQ